MESRCSASGYYSIYFAFSLLISFLLLEIKAGTFIPKQPEKWAFGYSTVMVLAGASAGFLNFLMMGLIARCLQIGPAGLTFAFQSSASVLPSLLLFAFFGAPFGFTLTISVLIGLALIVVGLFVSAGTTEATPASAVASRRRWFFLVMIVFGIQGAILSIFQWKCLLFLQPLNPHPLLPCTCCPKAEVWFLPSFFFVPVVLQMGSFILTERRMISWREGFLGSLAGLLNGGSTYILLMSIRVATPFEKLVVCPLFSISLILLCNFWAKALYREPINWIGTILCLVGVGISSLL